MRIGLSCQQFSQPVKDGIGVYADALSLALGKRPDVNVLKCRVKNYEASLASSLLFNFPYYRSNQLQEAIDLLHVTDYRIPKVKKIPVIATLHDAIPFQYPEWVNANWRKLKNKSLISSAKWLTHVIALSHFAVPDLVKYWGIPVEKITVVYPGIAKKWFMPLGTIEKENVLTKYHIRRNYFLFVGTLQPRKNIHRILLAYRSLPNEIKRDYSLILVGKSGWKNEALLKDLQELSDADQVKWLKYVPPEDIRALYQSATAFVFPSLYEGFGLPILEAFASKTPVITSINSAMSEVADNAALFVDPCSVESIRDAFIKLIEDGGIRKKLIAMGEVRCRSFSWEKCAEETFSVYTRRGLA